MIYTKAKLNAPLTSTHTFELCMHITQTRSVFEYAGLGFYLIYVNESCFQHFSPTTCLICQPVALLMCILKSTYAITFM